MESRSDAGTLIAMDALDSPLLGHCWAGGRFQRMYATSQERVVVIQTLRHVELGHELPNCFHFFRVEDAARPFGEEGPDEI